MDHFNEADLPLPLFHRLEQMGFTVPTPIQAQAIPPALKGEDILGSAQTGTGKTAAYGIPLVTQLLNQDQGSAVVLLPTRELAGQVMQVLRKFIGSSKISATLLIGGEPMAKQLRQLQASPRLIVGTPGRVNDHLKRRTLDLSDTNFLVLDEVDRMLDMGFGIQLDEIVKHLTKKRQTLMFSATLPQDIKKLSAKYLINPVRISIGSTVAPAAKVKQEHIRLKDSDKYDRLVRELDQRTGSILVFVKTKIGADRVSYQLRKIKHQVDALHGDMRQHKRNKVVSNFRNQTLRILVATDVAARGLDIPHIEHVINYDLPHNPEDYIHRIGRTARGGAEGCAVNFISPSDGGRWRDIQLLLDPKAIPDFVERPKSAQKRKGNKQNPKARKVQSGRGAKKKGGKSR